MERYSDAWLQEIFMRGVVERAIERVEQSTKFADQERRETLAALRRELRGINARLQEVE